MLAGVNKMPKKSLYACPKIGLFAEPADRSARQVNPNTLDLRVEVKRMTVHFSPITGLLVAAKRRGRIKHIEGIDPNHASFDLAREAMGSGDVPGPNARRQTVNRVVGLFHQVVFVFEADH